MIFFVTWFPTFLRETRGVSLMQAGLLTSYAGAAAMVGGICGGYASDWLLARTGSKRLARQALAAVAMATCACLILLSAFVAEVNAAIALISAGAFIGCFGGVAGYTVAIDYSGDRVGTVFGAMNMAGSFGAMLFPLTDRSCLRWSQPRGPSSGHGMRIVIACGAWASGSACR